MSDPLRDPAHKKPLIRALRGEAVWPPPMWLMRQAGRYLPEYRELRAHAGDFVSLCTTPPMAAEVTLQPVRRYGMDGAILFSDILMVPWALGQGLRFEQGEGPVLPPLEDRAALDRLEPDRVLERVAPILETVRRVAAGLRESNPDTALIGFAGAPFTVACYMVEGGGSKEFVATRRMAHADPALFDALVDVLVDATVEYLCGQAEAGAEALMLFDSWSGLLSPRLFARYVTAPAARIAEAVRARHPDLPLIGFPRLAGVLVGSYARGAGMDAVALDTGADLRVAAAMLPDGITTQGNLDPLALLAGGEALRAEAQGVLDAARGRAHVFNLGHGILPPTPPEHVSQLVEQVRAA